MKTKTLLLPLISTLLLSGCSSINVKTEYTHGYPFNSVKTYAWADAPKETLSLPDTYLNPELPKAIDREMAIKDIAHTEDLSKADVRLSYYVKVKEEHGYTSASDHGDGREFSGGLVLGNDNIISYQQREPDLTHYGWEIGTLNVMIHDAKTGNEIWHGTAQVELNRSETEEKQKELLDKVAEKLMTRYPPILGLR